MPPRRFDRLLRLLLIAHIVLVAWIVHDVAYVTMYRLYVSHRVDAQTGSSAAQRFDIDQGRVVPQIAMRDDDRLAFRVAIGRPSTFEAQIRTMTAGSAARYEVRWRGASGDRLLARGDTSSAESIRCSIPAQAGVIELAGHGGLVWVDPRLVRDLQLGPQVVTLAVLIPVWIATARRSLIPRTRAARLVWFRRVASAAAVFTGLISVEVALRALGDRIPAGIAAERHDLGEVGQDPRWEDTRRFGRRLRPHVDTMNEWRSGDIVRMGFIPPAVGEERLHRFRVHTDAEGFRNARTRARIDVAALGDSFTDAMTIDASDAWPSLLEQRTGWAVQNYGTAGFGPQQELRVLTDYAAQHAPRLVVLAYFAGNDLFDAEAFDEFDRSDGVVRRPPQGWRIKEVVSRADTWFLVSALRAAGAWTSARERAEASTTGGRQDEPRLGPATASFDRGLFSAAVQGRQLRWAFMPPYLNTLNFSKQDLAARPGWTLTTQAIAGMRDEVARIGAELVVMFLPFKSQVYLPLLEDSLPADDLSRSLHYYLPDLPHPDVARLSRNRLAQNDLMRRFCAEARIRFLDTTPALEARLRAGENVYFPDESHLNETGHAVVADALIAFLQR